ncbi:protein-L-isoaspartate O-methyltransferase family protein [Thiosocius teredinicola]|uniref:protein-L-isoaspartate O-methyltransferase family protein n=1 Tax=Thiosocius teredinicola TaxID=1973002 RepID=UPI000991214C
MLANDLELARFNMVAQQIRPNEVIDERVLESLQAVPRERFVSDEYCKLAFADVEIPIGEGEVMMKPLLEARMLQALQVEADDSVLEIGTGSGFITACLARLGGVVTSYEIHPALSKAASDRLTALETKHVELVTGDALNASLAPDTFKVIAVTGSLPTYSESLEMLLAPGGRMFVVVGEAPAMTAMLVTRNDDGEIWKENLFETVVPALHNAPQPSHFTF